MKFGEWIPMWLDIYKQGTIKQGSYRQLKNLENLIPDDLKQMEIGEILPLHTHPDYSSMQAAVKEMRNSIF